MKKHPLSDNTIWSIDIPFGFGFAEIAGDPFDFEEADQCEQCGFGKSVKPGVIEAIWEAGSDQIGDFTASVGPAIGKREILEELREQFSGFDLIDMSFPDLKSRGSSKRKRRRKQVPLPYEGPQLSAVWVTHEVDMESPKIEIEQQCDACGSIVYRRFVGLADRIGEDIKPRKSGHGFFVAREQLRDNDIFRPKWTGFTLCTDTVRQTIESRGWNNILFLDVGEIVD